MRKEVWICATLLMGMLVLQIGVAQAEINPVTAQKITIDDGLVTIDGNTFSNGFGLTVSVDGNTALIGADSDDDNGDYSGSSYVFVRSETGEWIQQAKLTANDAAAHEMFGKSVSLSGNTALIGAHYDQNGNYAGAAYVFVRSSDGTWTQQAKLTAADGNTWDLFDSSVYLNGDTALIGTNYYRDAGSVYVFVRSSDGTWNQQAKLIADDGATGDKFGSSVSLNGNTALIGVERDDGGAGSAYVFVRSGTEWTQQAKLSAEDSVAGNWFGSSVSLSDDDTALVGAMDDDHDGDGDPGAAYVFVRSGTSWTQQAKLTADDGGADDGFGFSVAMSGNRALIGAPFNDDQGSCHQEGYCSGAAYLFVRSSDGTWTQQTKIADSSGDNAIGQSMAQLGASVSLSGSTALIYRSREQ